MKQKDGMIWGIVSNAVMALMSLLALLPFLLLVMASFTDNQWATANGFSFFPGKFSMSAYAYISNQWSTIGRAYAMTIVVSVIGTAVSLFVTAGFAYALASEILPGRRILNFLCVFTMLFNGGLVASYYCWVSIFHVRDTLGALILPGLLMNAFNVILVKNYFRNSVPASLIEAARIDGAGEIRIYARIVLPLSVPIIATIGLMTGIAYWNDWTNGLYYLTERNGRKFYTIQLVLNSINENINFLSANSNIAALGNMQLPTTTMRMAIAVVGILPVILAYPFFQKYFVKGITLGGVKE